MSRLGPSDDAGIQKNPKGSFVWSAMWFVSVSNESCSVAFCSTDSCTSAPCVTSRQSNFWYPAIPGHTPWERSTGALHYTHIPHSSPTQRVAAGNVTRGLDSIQRHSAPSPTGSSLATRQLSPAIPDLQIRTWLPLSRARCTKTPSALTVLCCLRLCVISSRVKEPKWMSFAAMTGEGAV